MQVRSTLLSVFAVLSLVLLSLLSVYLVQAPEALPANAPLKTFSAGRAMRQLKVITKEPHAMGTAAHAKVRNYLLQEMQQLDLNPQVQEADAINQMVKEAAYVGHVYNIMGRLKGRQSGKAVLLMAHYDSQPNALGAGDNGAGVAALLETARALRQSEPLQHDVIFLLTDGEEYGLYGSRAFLAHPWAKQVAVVLNVEGRGNTGPSMSFEISPQNGWVIEAFTQAAPYPFASSLMYEVYRILPNFTDFTPFREAGYTGINSGFIGGFVHYHKLTDSAEKLDQKSLQHHGSNMLALTRYFGNIALEQTKAPDKVFFNAAGTWIIQYPASQNLVWVILVTILFVITWIAGLEKQVLTVPQVLVSFFLYLSLLAIITGLFILINNLVKSFLPSYHSINGIYGAGKFFGTYLLITIGLFLLLSWLIKRWVRSYSLLMGIYFLWYVLVLLLFFRVPSSTYILLFPLLFCLSGTLIIFLQNLHQKENNLPYLLIILLTGLPAIFLLMPLIWQLFVAFELQLPMASMLLLALFLGLFVPLFSVVEQTLKRRMQLILPLMLLIGGVILAIWAIKKAAPSPEQPLHSHVSYYLDADKPQAFWASAYQRTDDWNKQFFTDPTVGSLSEIYPMASPVYLKNAAKITPLAVPVAEVLTDSIYSGNRLLQLRLHSPRGAAHLEAVLLTQSKDLVATTLNGMPLNLKPIKTAKEAVYYLKLNGLPVSKQVILAVRLKQTTKLNLLLYDQSIGLPPSLVNNPAPDYVIPEQGRESNLTVVRKRYNF